MSKEVKWFIIGFIAVFIIKYGILGLNTWNSILHPHRTIVDSQNQPEFSKPLLGILG